MAGTVAPNIVTDGLVLYLDAANTKSYVSGSTTWVDIAAGNNSTLTAATSSLNAIEFTRSNNTRATIPTLDLSSTNVITVDFWVNFKTLPTVSGYSGDYTRLICELSDNLNLVSDSFLISVEYELTGFRWLAASRGNGVSSSGYNIKNLITPLPIINTWYNASFQINHTPNTPTTPNINNQPINSTFIFLSYLYLNIRTIFLDIGWEINSLTLIFL
jgi:hypothetical protein